MRKYVAKLTLCEKVMSHMVWFMMDRIAANHLPGGKKGIAKFYYHIVDDESKIYWW